MDYQDRLILTAKNFGRRVVLVVARGKVKYEKDGQTTTITNQLR
jgi:hypothetical protein